MRTSILKHTTKVFTYYDENGNVLNNLTENEKLLHSFLDKRIDYREDVVVLAEFKSKTVKENHEKALKFIEGKYDPCDCTLDTLK